MVNDEIKMKNAECDVFDKKQIALAIRNSTLGDEIECYLRSEGIIESCDNCSLSNICTGIDKVRDEYMESTSNVIKNLSFRNRRIVLRVLILVFFDLNIWKRSE